MTALDLITTALRKVGALAAGESLESSEASDGLAELNRMLDSWSNENLMIYAVVEEEFALTASKASYTMGSSGDFNTTRPVEIVKAGLRDLDSPVNEYPVTIYTVEQWSDIVAKTTDSTYPWAIYPENTYPLETINVYPVPTTNYKLVLYSLKPLSSFSALTTVASFAPGYEDAVIYNLAVRLAPEYGKSTTAELLMLATNAKKMIKRRNHRAKLLKVDPALIEGKGQWDWRTGGFD